MRQNKAKRKLRIAAVEAAEREPSVYGRTVLKRLADAVAYPKARDPRV